MRLRLRLRAGHHRIRAGAWQSQREAGQPDESPGGRNCSLTDRQSPAPRLPGSRPAASCLSTGGFPRQSAEELLGGRSAGGGRGAAGLRTMRTGGTDLQDQRDPLGSARETPSPLSVTRARAPPRTHPPGHLSFSGTPDAPARLPRTLCLRKPGRLVSEREASKCSHGSDVTSPTSRRSVRAAKPHSARSLKGSSSLRARFPQSDEPQSSARGSLN